MYMYVYIRADSAGQNLEPASRPRRIAEPSAHGETYQVRTK